MRKIPAPKSLLELKERLDNIVGKSIAELARELEVPLPANLKNAKGFNGELLEIALGADARKLPIPDFPNLLIELKTIPVDERRMPLESTFICHLNLGKRPLNNFFESLLYKKISLILFVAIEGSKAIAKPQRRILAYYLFKPDAKTLSVIRDDYEEVMEQISLGRAHELNARMGTIVQVRPKGASGRELVPYINESGETGLTRPRGFYFRANFTKSICKNMFRL